MIFRVSIILAHLVSLYAHKLRIFPSFAQVSDVVTSGPFYFTQDDANLILLPTLYVSSEATPNRQLPLEMELVKRNTVKIGSDNETVVYKVLDIDNGVLENPLTNQVEIRSLNGVTFEANPFESQLQIDVKNEDAKGPFRVKYVQTGTTWKGHNEIDLGQNTAIVSLYAMLTNQMNTDYVTNSIDLVTTVVCKPFRATSCEFTQSQNDDEFAPNTQHNMKYYTIDEPMVLKKMSTNKVKLRENEVPIEKVTFMKLRAGSSSSGYFIDAIRMSPTCNVSSGQTMIKQDGELVSTLLLPAIPFGNSFNILKKVNPHVWYQYYSFNLDDGREIAVHMVINNTMTIPVMTDYTELIMMRTVQAGGSCADGATLKIKSIHKNSTDNYQYEIFNDRSGVKFKVWLKAAEAKTLVYNIVLDNECNQVNNKDNNNNEYSRADEESIDQAQTERMATMDMEGASLTADA